MNRIQAHGGALILAALVALPATQAPGAGSPPLFNYQGYLTDASDVPYANGFYDIEFRIWSSDSGGRLIWGEKYNLYIMSGRFNVILGQGGTRLTNDVPAALVAGLGDCFKTQPSIAGDDGSVRWIGLKVVTSQSGQPITNAVEIAPRQRLLSSPYALRADSASYAETAATATNAVRLNNLPATDYIKKSAALKNAGGTPILAFTPGTGEATPSLLRENGGAVEATAPVRMQSSLQVSGVATLSTVTATSAGIGGAAQGGVALKITGKEIVTGDLEVNGALSGKGTIPIGCIVMWSGSSTNIPAGWALCNGAQNTPDLRDRFVVGASGEYAVGNKGGLKEVTLTEAQMPAHNHGDGDYNQVLKSDCDGTSAGYDRSCGEPNILSCRAMATKGGSQAHENRPPYYALCFIMRVQ